LYSRAEHRLNRLIESGYASLLKQGRIGVEKESLRVSQEGTLARTPHPRVLGSALTHPNITTDYSEAMLEFITEPYEEVGMVLKRLRDIHQFVHRQLQEEILWATSMPCVLHGDNSIPIARYGDSNLGMMKTVYRRGLGHRYGRPMQVIAGIHFNYSFSDAFWKAYQELEGDRGSPQEFKSAGYLSLTRNLLRLGWLIPYLFGASPAVCKSFVGPVLHRLQDYDENTYFDPYATSLRLGDIGYTNKREHETGIHANYDSLNAYVDTLIQAIETPCQAYEKIGVEVDGRYEQLNANILQIENEYYSSVRPKQLSKGLEKPVLALRRRGVSYIELRSLDVDIYSPLGIQEQRVYFLEVFMIFCLLQDSPLIEETEHAANDRNLIETAHHGRRPGFTLSRQGGEISLKDWALELIEAMEAVCALLDGGGDGVYRRALEAQREAVLDPGRTPSARILADMKSRGESFYDFSRHMSLEHHQYFCDLPVNEEVMDDFVRKAERSHRQQQEIEAQQQLPFGQFLEAYFNQDKTA
jgi:glutamate--cysteine ligase